MLSRIMSGVKTLLHEKIVLRLLPAGPGCLLPWASFYYGLKNGHALSGFEETGLPIDRAAESLCSVATADRAVGAQKTWTINRPLKDRHKRTSASARAGRQPDRLGAQIAVQSPGVDRCKAHSRLAVRAAHAGYPLASAVLG